DRGRLDLELPAGREFDPAAAVDLDAGIGLHRDLAGLEFELLAAGVDDDALLPLDQDGAVAVYGDLGFRLVEFERQFVVLGGHGDPVGLSLLIQQVDPVTETGDHAASVDRTGS